ncbi:iron-regulated protein [Candidatus Scalindua japonica]|uniref:Iron-regulated protein n=2 Tax=Candidatus Scalindua japonica TaxID=1284222 RepID=A0A286U305_9BACT|nr:iron-regulated protein [Candidatus Scalindua japonica]
MGCHSVANTVTVKTDRLRNFPAEVNAGDIVHVATGEKVTFSQLAESFDGARIIYVGEVHSNRESHELELQVLKEFYKRNGGNLAVGMEMFKRPHQEILDKWTHGKISEKDLLYLTDWDYEWGYDYNHYKEIMNFIRNNKIPVIALNITKDLGKTIRKKGIEGLSEEERENLPEIDTSDFYHRKYLERILSSHGHGDTDMSGLFEKFYQVQCTWEDVMADSITRYLSSPEAKGKKLLVFVGGGHIIYHFGIPKRVYRNNHLPYLTITTYEKRTLEPDSDHPLFAGDIPLQPADYVKVVQLPEPKETKVMLGVMIRNMPENESEGKKKEENIKDRKYQVVMDSVGEDSPAGKANLQAGDIILSMDGEVINRVFDVIYHVRQKKAGDTCNIEILRGEEKITVDVTFFESKKNG